MREETVKTDITVIGGGLAGVCAAVAAARLGQKVALVQNRPVLGGNSSSEVRVWVVGATSHGVNRYARETGIMGELFVENQYRNPDGNPYIWDLVVLEKVKAEANIELFLNTDVHEIELSEKEGSQGAGVIKSVTGWMMGSERRIRFESEIYMDCTGDGLIGFLAGANYRIGREARHEFNEEWAPEVADNSTLGSTLLFYTKDAGQSVKYIPPSFAKDITQTSIPVRRVIRSGDNGCHYWWIEWGGEMDTVHDNERIRDELWSVIYGIWDYIKNSGKFNADHMTLEWVGSIPGKREYRRFVGDYMLNQNDVIAQEPFEDRIAFGGWSIDLHPPQGMYAEESGSKHYHADGIYHIPFRSLYSNNVDNLMFAGRNISATHVAFGTTRVMATCAVMGEAAGTGAALSVQKRITPRQLQLHHLHELQQTLLRQDASIIGLKNEDNLDIARTAVVSASSQQKQLHITNEAERYRLKHNAGQLLPVTGSLDTVHWLIDAEQETTLEIELYKTGRKENYIPHELVKTVSVRVNKGEKQWVETNFHYENDRDKPKNDIEAGENVFIILRANPHIALYLSAQPFFGVLSFHNQVQDSKDFADFNETQKTMAWTMGKLNRKPFCMKVSRETEAYHADSVIDGYARPYGGPHIWMSEPVSVSGQQQQWIALEWDNTVSIKQVEIIFNDDVNEDLINLHHHRTPYECIPEIVRDYRLEAYIAGEWQLLERIEGNHIRKRKHSLEQTVTTKQLRLVAEATNGSETVQVVEIRVYE